MLRFRSLLFTLPSVVVEGEAPPYPPMVPSFRRNGFLGKQEEVCPAAVASGSPPPQSCAARTCAFENSRLKLHSQINTSQLRLAPSCCDEGGLRQVSGRDLAQPVLLFIVQLIPVNFRNLDFASWIFFVEKLPCRYLFKRTIIAVKNSLQRIQQNRRVQVATSVRVVDVGAEAQVSVKHCV